MWGWGWVRVERLDAVSRELELTRNMLERMESELHYWRQRADEERERADRTMDTVMQQNGLPEVTATVRKEQLKKLSDTKDEIDKRQEELAEMFTDSFDTEDEFNWIDPDLAQAAQGWMDQAKQARAGTKSESNESN